MSVKTEATWNGLRGDLEAAEARVAALEAAIQAAYDELGAGDDEDCDSAGNCVFAVLCAVCPPSMKGNDADDR